MIRPVLLWLCAFCFASRLGLAEVTVTPEQVNQAIERGIKFLKARQAGNGSWFYHAQYEPGLTALAVLALTHAGVPADDPSVQQGIKYILQKRPQSTYAAGLVAMALADIDPSRYRTAIRQAMDFLVRSQGRDGTWTYRFQRRYRGGGDHSNTQFGVLGLHAADRSGLRVPETAWKRIVDHFKSAQTRDGGWGYRFRSGPTTSMTAAGTASLLIATERIYRKRHVCGRHGHERSIEAGITWLSRRWPTSLSRHGYYTCYALERVGILSGRKYIGKRDWYRELASTLVRVQTNDGRWGGNPGGSTAVVNSCFALLTLAKGKTPILINKLQYAGDWNNDPHDVKHLTEFISSTLEKKVGWQVLPENAPASEWLTAPLVFMNGHNAPKLTDEAIKNCKTFLDEGGLLFAEACCARKEFDKGFRQLIKKAFPEYELERLPPDHDIFRTYYRLDPRKVPFYGLNRGCRTAIIYLPRDCSCQWDMGNFSALAFKVGMNVALYAMGTMPLKDKLDRIVVKQRGPEEKPSDELVARGALTIAQVEHNGDYDTDKKMLRRLQAFLREKVNMSVTFDRYKISLTSPDLVNFPVLYMTGHRAFQLRPGERKALREYLSRGGFLFADACCGRMEFNKAFRKEMQLVFPEHPLTVLAADHPVYTCGFNINHVEYKPAILKEKPQPGAFRLEGVILDGRAVVIYSKYDLGCAIQDHPCPGCRGIKRDSALKVAANIIIYALGL